MRASNNPTRMPSLRLHGQDRQMSDLSVEELQSNIAACQLMFPKWRTGYQVIIADPPWQYNTMYAGLQGVAPYPTMGWEELADLPVGKLADPSMCALFLWATAPLIHKAIALMEHWGFEYKCVWKVWRKTNGDGSPVCGPGWWSRPSCEFLLVGTKGNNILKHKTTNAEPQEFASVREGHSAKPAAITQAVADFLDVPGPRIELWARRSHPLFDSWGLEVPGFFAKATRHRARRQPDTNDLLIPPEATTPKPKKKKKLHSAHAHLQLAPPPPPSPIPEPAPPSKTKKVPVVKKPPVKRLTEDEAWQKLEKLNPNPSKKRKTVHKDGCGCFLCSRKTKVSSV